MNGHLGPLIVNRHTSQTKSGMLGSVGTSEGVEDASPLDATMIPAVPWSAVGCDWQDGVFRQRVFRGVDGSMSPSVMSAGGTIDDYVRAIIRAEPANAHWSRERVC